MLSGSLGRHSPHRISAPAHDPYPVPTLPAPPLSADGEVASVMHDRSHAMWASTGTCQKSRVVI
eukprot:9652531-Heterocapsa_arctica.AAC.1